MRVLRDRAKYRFSVVFSTHKPLEDLIGQDLLYDFYQFVAGHTVYLPLLDKPGLDFRISYMEKVSGKKLEKEIIDAIIKVTAGHPNLTRLSVEAALESNQQLATSSQGLIQFYLEQKPMRAALFDIWKSLSPSEQKILEKSTGGTGGKAPDSAHAFGSEGETSGALAGGKPVTGPVGDYYLNSVGLIKDSKITIPILEQFIKKEVAQTLPLTKQKIAFDPNTHDITKGDLILSGTLTSSEFKLLRFLLQNSQRIVEREEIINTVWANTKSTAGVTDQALDQLIFRVRKKVEDDPNKPEHLQTVKGRGFRFTP